MKSKIFMLMFFLAFISSSAWSAEYRKGEVLAVFRVPEGVSVSAAGESVFGSVSEIGAAVSESYETLSEIEGKIIVLVRSDTMTTEALIASLKSRSDVLSATPNYYSHAQSITASVLPNDPGADLCWGLNAIRATEVWEYTTGSKEIHAGVIDTGIYASHPDLEANIAPSLSLNTNTVSGDYDVAFTSWDADLDGHGTHVAGTIGAVGNNGIGVVGVNWNVGLIALRVFDIEDAKETISYEMRALNHIAMLLQRDPDLKIAALNLSLGSFLPYTPEEMMNNAYWLAFHAIDQLDRTIMVFAAGNNGVEVGTPALFDDPTHSRNGFMKGDYTYPASFTGLNNAIVVGATASDDSAAFFSNWGDNVDIAAPGVDIVSTYSPIALEDPSMYTNMNGTSMAAPHVTGAAALLMSASPNAKPSEIKRALLEGANKNKNPLVFPYAGFVARRVNRWVSELDAQIEMGEIPIESRDAVIERVTREAEELYAPYKAFDGTARVSRTGLLDVKAAYDILKSSSSSAIGSSSSGCNGGFTLMTVSAVLLVWIIAMMIKFVRRNLL